ncbi:hypothetical protein Agabi119p4_7603 [Agaricus bisporus var. burnettii]|uniref:Uncharacterized protein n=1 Tax=Agaricus bisporus var. burnettii TaxID=192524 RepID=A0A8H7C8J2_AGABI|nr:hypothetical protein Agabi119p4_7603 [Agaricus bisporus var. burnettii]
MASADLRHCTSAAHLRRVRSPASIPSSPTSVRSSSSAIFERDIEPLVCPSPTSHNPHRIPRAKTTELSVPSVLDSAASVLATLDESNDVAVVAPASSTSPAFSPSSGFTSPIGSFRSRSPSPLGLRVASGGSGGGGPMELLLSIPSAQQSSSPRGVTQSLEQDGEGHPHHHHHRPSNSSPISISTSPMMLSSHPPSPTATSSAALMPPTKRLSFMSYNDLLTSTPSSLISLSSLTNAASSMDPPPHIPSVHGYNHHPCSPGVSGGGSSSSARTSLRGFVTSNNNNNTNTNNNNNEDNVGGEWEREGLGKGLEERLEAWILGSTQQQQQQQQRSTSLGSSVHHPPMIGARI